MNDKKLTSNMIQDTHSLFLQAMETRYKEIISILGFVVTSVTGFLLIILKNIELKKTDPKDCQRLIPDYFVNIVNKWPDYPWEH